MSREEAIDAWLQHCAEAGHLTAAEAAARGLRETLPQSFARYAITRRLMVCHQRDCRWSLDLENEHAD